MSHVDHLLATRTPLELAKELAATAKENAALRDQVGALETEIFWMKVAERNDKMKIDTKDWEVLGHAGVDSGQLLLIDPTYLAHWEQKDFQDIRIYEHKTTGERLQYQVDFGNYQTPIPKHGGLTMNQLNETGEWQRVPNEPDGGFNYNAVSQVTLGEKMGGPIGFGVAFSSGWGDGNYAVQVKRNKEGRIMQVFINFEES